MPKYQVEFTNTLRATVYVEAKDAYTAEDEAYKLVDTVKHYADGWIADEDELPHEVG